MLPVLLVIVSTSCMQEKEKTMTILAGTGEAGFEDGITGKT